MRPLASWRGLVSVFLVLGFLAGPGQAQETNAVYALQVDGLACPFCAYGIEKQLLAIEGVQTVETDIKLGTVTVTTQPGSRLEEETARKAVEAAGFTLRGFQGQGPGE